jgi:hypothetical protein
MRDDDLPGYAASRILMIGSPADQVKLPPPPPARVDESAELWRPNDDATIDHRVPLAAEGDESAQAAAGIWMGMTALHAVLADGRPGHADVVDLRRRTRDDEDDKPSPPAE